MLWLNISCIGCCFGKWCCEGFRNFLNTFVFTFMEKGGLNHIILRFVWIKITTFFKRRVLIILWSFSTWKDHSMIETHRLKNVVIFIQINKSFVLSKKIILRLYFPFSILSCPGCCVGLYGKDMLSYLLCFKASL